MTIPTAAAGFVGFYAALLAAHMWAAPPQLFDPQAAKYLGRWLYLTYQSNVICCVYFGVALFDATLGGGAWSAPLMRFFPLVFSLGGFLSLAYYSLDHFNPENVRRKERCRSEYPYVHWCSHIEHGHAAPLVLLHAALLECPQRVALPTSYDVHFFVSVFILFYVVLVHANHFCTGRWPYAIIDDVTRIGGTALRIFFFVVLACAFVALGLGGAELVRARC